MQTEEQNLGSRLRILRKEIQYSQEDIAGRLGVSPATYAKWEGGKNQPNIENLRKLADLFGVSADYLIGRSDYKKVIKLEAPGQKLFPWQIRRITTTEEDEKAVRTFALMAAASSAYTSSADEVIKTLGLDGPNELRVLIKHAVDEGLVEIQNPLRAYGYEKQLVEKFLLRETVVVKMVGIPEMLHPVLIGRAVADFFAGKVKPGQIVGMTCGSTLLNMVAYLKHYKKKLAGIRLYPLDANPIIDQPDLHTSTLIGMLKYFLRDYSIEACALHASPGESWPPSDKEVQRILVEAKNANIAFVGIGALDFLRANTLLRRQLEVEGYDIEKLINSYGAVGDILLHLIDAEGKEINHEFNRKVPRSIKLEELRTLARKPETRVIGVAYGVWKAAAVAAVLKGNYINTLIVDDALAKAILNPKKSSISSKA